MTEDLPAAVSAFFATEILPRHREWVRHVAQSRDPAPFMAALQGRARTAGLWNLALPDRLSNRAFAPLDRKSTRLNSSH